MCKRLLVNAFLATGCIISPMISQATSGPPPGAGMRAPGGPLQVHQLAPSVYWAQGSGGNVGFIIGDKGVIVVDTTVSEASAKELIADIATITPKPVTAVILTHGDIDHIAGLGAFPAGIAIYAQENTTKRMQAAVNAGRSRVPADHLPNHSIANHESAMMSGQKLELLHWAPAHTDGDLAIFMPEQKIVFTGDIFALDQPRALIHREQDGTSEGWITSAKAIVALNASRFVVGHGDVQAKPNLEERINLVVAERKQITELIAAGKSLPEIKTIVDDPPQSAQVTPGAGGPRFTPFSEVVYQELTGKK